MRKLGVGLIGCGRISDLHAKGYMTSDKAEIVAVCDISEVRAKEKASKWGAKRYYINYKDLLKDDEYS